MNFILERFNVFMVPPVLSLIVGVFLGVLSLVKGKRKRDNLLFALVCLWYTLLAPVFIIHHLVDDQTLILRVERTVHFLYVFIPLVNVVFFHSLLSVERKYLEIACGAVSAVLAVLTQTDYYFTGLYSFQWGYIARGSVGFHVFGLYSFGVILYVLVLSYKKYIAEQNQIQRLKLKYIIFSIGFVVLLTIMNVPAINGYDFYPLGNFMFLPLAILAYGVLRYKIMDIRSVFHITFIWLVISSLIIVPNVILFYFVRPWFAGMDSSLLFVILLVWFALNHLYFVRIQPVINQWFNKRKYNLRKAELNFVQDIAFLKNTDDLSRQLSDVMKKDLSVKFAELYLRVEDTNIYKSVHEERIEIEPGVQEWFAGANHLADKYMVETNPYYLHVKDILMPLFNSLKCSYLVPFVHDYVLQGLLVLGSKVNLQQLSGDEIHFINNIRGAASISFSNSMMYQNLSNLKINLEHIVEDRTRELKKKNDQMVFELKVAKNVQQTILPSNLPDNDNIRIVAKMIPLMEVSGDFYDIVKVDDNRVAVVLVDVSGHGVPSALLTSMIKSEISQQLMKNDIPADSLASVINENLRPVLSEAGFYFTMFLCYINLAERMMEYTNCGHTDPYLLRDGAVAARLGTEGFFIGTPFDASYEKREIAVATGDRICMFTDGMTEMRGVDDYTMGEAKLEELLFSTAGLDVEAQLDAVLEGMGAFHESMSHQKTDDVTLLIIEIG